MIHCFAATLGQRESVQKIGYRLDDRGSIPGSDNDGISPPPRPDRLRGSTIHL